MTESPYPTRLYVVDTSSFIRLEDLPKGTFGRLWKRLDRLAETGALICPEEVRRELGDDDDEPAVWVRNHPEIIRGTARLWARASVVAAAYPDLVDLAKPNGSADPFVVALGLDERDAQQGRLWASDVIVVSEERRKAPSKVAVPDACDREGLKVVRLQGMFEAESWTDL